MKCLDIINRQNIGKSYRYIRENGFAAFLLKIKRKLSPDLYDIIRLVANKYLKGSGIEIGAEHLRALRDAVSNVYELQKGPVVQHSKRHSYPA